MMQSFCADTVIETLLDAYPKLAEVFNAHGMACVGCVFGRFHRLADAAAIYGVEVDVLMKEM
jgi:hybrid cluster-associated redox disulfide protein